MPRHITEYDLDLARFINDKVFCVNLRKRNLTSCY